MTRAALVCALALGAFALVSRWARQRDLDNGKQLFTGDVALKGQMTGDETLLPPEAVRCANCHSARQGASGSNERFGPVLNGAALLNESKRRGGPASLYDEPKFCRLLRQGIDPAQVMIPKAMPRYLISDQECHALWAYVTNL